MRHEEKVPVALQTRPTAGADEDKPMGEVIIFRKPMPRWRELLFTAIGVPAEHWGTPLGEAIALGLASRFAENESRETRH